MKIAVTSQDLRTITGHAGKTRRFLAFEIVGAGPPRELEPLDLPPDLTLHEFRGSEHPLQRFDALITGGAGDGFVRRLAAWGVQVAITDETSPLAGVLAFARGDLLPAQPGGGGHAHHHDDHHHDQHHDQHHDHHRDRGDGHHGCGNC